MTSQDMQQSDTHKIVSVGLGARSYDIHIGLELLTNAAQYIAPFITGRKLIIISDETVGALYEASLVNQLKPLARDYMSLRVPAGEASKSLHHFSALCEEILQSGIDRQTVLIALGGGVIGDLVGYVAASLLRGLDFIQIPTSLLAQVDSSVGGKTGINASAGKNLIGAFHQPRLVLADISVLDSLSPREMRAGYAEVVKYGLLGDHDFFEWLEANGAQVLARDPAALSYAVQTSCQAKADIVAADETEAGKRALLNLGHTFAHAFEAEAGYNGSLLHGEAVAAGLGTAFAFSAALGLCHGQDVQRAKAHLSASELPASRKDLPAGNASAEQLLLHMKKDKKVENAALTFILAHGIGAAEIHKNVPAEQVIDFLEHDS